MTAQGEPEGENVPGRGERGGAGEQGWGWGWGWGPPHISGDGSSITTAGRMKLDLPEKGEKVTIKMLTDTWRPEDGR